MASTELIRAGDITDAIDSNDLLNRIIAQNKQVVKQKVDKRIVLEWLENRKKELRRQYIQKAETAYKEIWSICSSKSVGHNYRVIDVRNRSINQCDDCKYADASSKLSNSSLGNDYKYEKKIADEMNHSVIKALADEMIKVDIEAGIFSWPTEEDYPNIRSSNPTKKRWIFG